MGYARHIGRIGALAVTLGVGVALASAPPAYADSPSSTNSSNSSNSSQKDSDSDSKDSTTKTGGEGTGNDGSVPSGSPAEQQNKGDAGDVEDGKDPGTKDAGTKDAVTNDKDLADDLLDADGGVKEGDADKDADSVDKQTVTPHKKQQEHSGPTPKVTAPSAADPGPGPADPPAEHNEDHGPAMATLSFTTTSTTTGNTPPTTFRTMATPAPATVQAPAPSLVGLVTNVVATVLTPFMSMGLVSPIQASLLLGVLGAVCNDIERALFPRTTNNSSRYTISQIDPTPNLTPTDTTPNVLVIGVDGTNLSRILESPLNEHFFALMDDGTTTAASIVGHTTVSNPSWTSMLTGVWGERAGVINNVFTPWTYNRWPTVFTQLENYDSGIDTTAIGDWDVINAIAGTGARRVDTNIYIPQIDGDTDWLATDDAVGAATVNAINTTATGTPSLIFSYFVGVDENGHSYGGASDQYETAINNVDDNLGEILGAVTAWETAHPTEGEWTIIMVTDHGHQPQKGFGHGFQSPDETATFVIAGGPDFEDGWINPNFGIIDTTPTLLTLFGAPNPGYFDGVSLTDLGGAYDPGAGLHSDLTTLIAANKSPDLITNIALSLRTIVAFVPYYVWVFSNDGTLPIPILGDVLYAATNIPAQIVALLTGVSGANIFPLLPPGPPTWPQDDETLTTRDSRTGDRSTPVLRSPVAAVSPA